MTIIIGLFVIFLASFSEGLSSIGFGASIPILALFISPKVVIPLTMILSAPIVAMILFDVRKHIDLKKMGILILFSIIGVPFGTYILLVVDIFTLKLLIGFIIILASIALLLNIKKRIKNEKLAFGSAGFISGLMNSSVGISFPPIALLFENQDMKKQKFRANLVAYSSILLIVTVLAFILGGLVNMEVLNYSAMFLPSAVAGTLLGIKTSSRVKDNSFKKFVLLVLIIAGVFSILSGLSVF